MPELQPHPISVPLSVTGLTSAEVKDRLKEFGFNEPVRPRRLSSLTQLLALFLNPLVIILLIACVVSFIVGNWINASIIVSMVLLSVALNFTQTARSRNAVNRLSSTVAPTATVLRDCVWTEIERREVVPGDLIKLRSGDLVPADARLLESRDLHVQESALTGESLPVKKSTEAADAAKEKDINLLFLGTSVISGTATAVVTGTGQNTKFGDIASQLSRKAPETEFERGTRRFGYLIARVVFALVIFVFFVNALMHRDPLESLLFSIALAVGLTPEFLPMIMTVTLGQGAKRMGKKKVIVKHLEAIQNFGSIDILCSDKTGTLTKGEMTLGVHVDPTGEPSEFPFYLAYLNSYFETGVTDPLNGSMATARLANPLDAAILFHDHPKIDDLKKIDEIPFDFERRRISIVVEDKEKHRMLVTKGAPESVLAACSSFRVGQKDVTL